MIRYNVKNLYDEVRVDQQVVHVYEGIYLENVVKISIASSDEALSYYKQEGHSQCTFGLGLLFLPVHAQCHHRTQRSQPTHCLSSPSMNRPLHP